VGGIREAECRGGAAGEAPLFNNNKSKPAFQNDVSPNGPAGVVADVEPEPLGTDCAPAAAAVAASIPLPALCGMWSGASDGGGVGVLIVEGEGDEH